MTVETDNEGIYDVFALPDRYEVQSELRVPNPEAVE